MATIYNNTETGLENLKNRGYEYILKIHKRDNDVSIQGLCDYLDITRQTLSRYKRRGKEWYNEIEFFNNLIQAKQLLKIKIIEN